MIQNLSKLFLLLIVVLSSSVAFAEQDITNNNSDTATNWTQRGGNSLSNEYVPITANPQAFHVIWKNKFNDQTGIFPWTIRVYNNKLFMIVDDINNNLQPHIVCLDAKTGNILWEKYFEDNVDIDDIAADNNKLFVTYWDQTKEANHFVAFDANSGAPIFDKNTGIYFLTVNQNKISSIGGDTEDGNTIMLFCFDENTGIPTLKIPLQVEQDSGSIYTEVMAGNNISVLVGHALNTYNADTGDLISHMNVDKAGYNFAYEDLTMDNNTQNIVFPYNDNLALGLSSVDIQNKVTNFTYNANQKPYAFNYLLSTANNTIYMETSDNNYNNILVAIDEKTGETLWITKIGHYNDLEQTPIITNNIVFASSNETIQAIDLKTHQIIWTYPDAEIGAIAQNTMFIVAGNTLYAMSLN